MVKINAGSVHRAINNLGFFTTLVHLFKFKVFNKYDMSVKKAATYTVQQPFPCFTVFIRLAYEV